MPEMLRSSEQKEVFVYRGANNYSIWLSFKEASAQLGCGPLSEEDIKLRDLCQLFYFFSFPQEKSIPCGYPDLMRLSPLSSKQRNLFVQKQPDVLLARN